MGISFASLPRFWAGCDFVPASPLLSGRKLVPEHGQATAGCVLCYLVLDDVPVLGQFAILEAHDIRHDPVPVANQIRRMVETSLEAVALCGASLLI